MGIKKYISSEWCNNNKRGSVRNRYLLIVRLKRSQPAERRSLKLIVISRDHKKREKNKFTNTNYDLDENGIGRNNKTHTNRLHIKIGYYKKKKHSAMFQEGPRASEKERDRQTYRQTRIRISLLPLIRSLNGKRRRKKRKKKRT